MKVFLVDVKCEEICCNPLVNTMLLVTNCEVHTENIWTAVLKYGPNEVRSLQKTKVPNISRMDRTNRSIRALLYSQYFNQKFCVQVHTGFGRSIRLWTDLGLTNQIASVCLAIQ